MLLFLLVCFHQSDLFSEERKQRIISLTPATTEILYRLGLEDQIVGVTTFCNYPPEAIDKEKVGTFSLPAIEKIILLKPDLILAAGLEQASTVGKLRQLKLNIYVNDPASFEELFASIKEIGERTHREKEAAALINEMKAELEQVRERVASRAGEKRPTVFIEIFHNPLFTAGKGSFVDELIRIAGGENIAHDTPRAYSYFSAEQVIMRNPDCIILGSMGETTTVSSLMSRLGWEEINAVKNSRVYSDINPDLFLRPGPRLVEGLKEIHYKLYP